MEIKIIDTKENKVLNRNEIELIANITDRTLSKTEAKKEISKFLNLNPEGMFIKNITQERGLRQCRIMVHYYNDAKNIDRLELKYLINRLSKKTAKKEDKTEAK
ncbi:MAG: hypothetical protein QXD11_00115 [Candidatus Micrarchaeaceae archaeon]